MAKPVFILDPRETDSPVELDRPAPLASLEGARLALLDNRKPGAGTLLAALGEILVRDCGVAETSASQKESAGREVASELVAQIASWATAAVTGIGDCAACTASSFRDATALERAGVRTVLLITEPFVGIRDRIAQMAGLPGYPAVVLRHPISILTPQALAGEAERVAGEVAMGLVAMSAPEVA